MESFVGKRFGRLVVIDEFYKKDKKGHNKWFVKCRCDCGNEREIYKYSLIAKRPTVSCGCRLNEIHSKAFYVKHNLYGTHIYHVWTGMKGRCYNKNNKKYKNYGGRGIKVCNDWLDKDSGVANFYQWAINNGYDEKLSLDRIDVNGGYEPNNCRWTDMITQENNRTNNRFVDYKGKQLTLAELSRETNVPYKKLYERIIKYKWTVYKAVQDKGENNYEI